MDDQQHINLRFDGSQLAFGMALRALALKTMSEEELRVCLDTMSAQIEQLYGRVDLSHEAGDPLQIALSAIEAIFAPTTSSQPFPPGRPEG